MIINLGKMSLETKIAIVLLAVVSLMLIGLSIVAKEILGVLSGVIFWIIIIDMLVVEAQNQHIQMLNLLCDVQQEILAEKFNCTRAEIDQMCTERLKERNEKSR